MKGFPFLAFAVLLSPLGLSAQTPTNRPAAPDKAFQEQLRRDGVTMVLSEVDARKLLLQKPVFQGPHSAMQARISATIVVGLEIGKSGQVMKTILISGPKMLQKPVLDHVRQYTFRPYVIQGQAKTVATTLKIVFTFCCSYPVKPDEIND